MNGIVDKLSSYSFLNEPYWRWFVFIVVIGAFMNAWSGVLKKF